MSSIDNTPLRTILVTGATGHQGGALIDALVAEPSSAKQFSILAITRNANSSSARKLLSKSSNIKIVQGDLDTPSKIFQDAKALSPDGKIWGVFSMFAKEEKPASAEKSHEVKQGYEWIDECIKNHVEHFVYSSTDRGGEKRSWENPTPIPHFKTKYLIEQHLFHSIETTKSTMKWAIFRPTMFYENLEPTYEIKMFMTFYRDVMGNKPVGWIATDDIGVFASKAFLYPEEYQGRAITLAGEEITMDQLNQIFINVTGKPVPVTFGFMGSLMRVFAKHYAIMVDWMKDEGYQYDIAELRRIHPGLMDVETWLREKSRFEKKA
ncbi:uncharacterized protein IL334_006303 [Kwoniella shivajii]|uniref:NmrA-like domain-containing protein n=1 Tax=Kwoniella shivajii TaxID=564305 RepID=A0ABZ1D7N2_9TREE|nr:hypothetical protein IL334_006303 [Kwoniella shivajii]